MRLLFAMAVLFLSPYTAVHAKSLDEEVAHYLEIFKGDNVAAQTEAVESFAWKGVSDTRLFDAIEQRLLREHEAASKHRNEKNRVARYIRALGFSGAPKYRPTLERFAQESSAYARFGQAALADSINYQTWNPIIANRATFDPKYDDDTNKIFNILRADDLSLKRVGAKRVYFGHWDEPLLDLLAADLRKHYVTTEREHADAVAWMAKAIGRSAKEKYRPLLAEVSAKATLPKIRDNAERALRRYGREAPIKDKQEE